MKNEDTFKNEDLLHRLHYYSALNTKYILFGDVAFPSILFRFLFVWRVRRTFFPSGLCFFYLVTTGWIFDISLLCENLFNQFNQSINQCNCDVQKNVRGIHHVLCCILWYKTGGRISNISAYNSGFQPHKYLII